MKRFFWFFAWLFISGSCNSPDLSKNSADTFEKSIIQLEKIPLYAYNRKLHKVQTDKLSGIQLGQLNNTIFGTNKSALYTQLIIPSNPIFGRYSKTVEENSAIDKNPSTIDEKETVTKVILRIPFHSKLLETKKDGSRKFRLDSIYGNRNAEFKFKVEEINYFLRDLDPSTGFLKRQKYYSTDKIPTNTSPLNADVNKTYNVEVFNKEILKYKKDNPQTTKDESKEISQRITPQLEIELDPRFFQSKIIDKEGLDELSSLAKFKRYFKGLKITTYDHSNDVMMVLHSLNRKTTIDTPPASIEIQYSYKRIDDSNNKIYDDTASFNITLGGIYFNQFEEINSKVPIDDKNASQLFLNGSNGYYTEIQLFDQQGTSSTLESLRKEFKEKDYLINEANIIFYVDKTSEGYSQQMQPERIYIFDLDNGSKPLIDYVLDPTQQSVSIYNTKLVHSGKLVKTKEGKDFYKIRLTKHINKIIRHGADNVRLGMVVTSNILDTSVGVGCIDDSCDPKNQINYPRAAAISPLKTVLYGGGDKANIKTGAFVEILYTKF